MATLNNYSYLTLIELAKRTSPRGNTAVIAEILNETNEVIQDAIWLEANDTFSHKVTRRLSLPTASWRKLNEGVGVNASRTYEIVETIGMLETYAEVDIELVKAAPDPKSFRMMEASAFIEGMGQQFAHTMMYGDTATRPETFTGFAPRLNAVAQRNVANAGGSNDLSSIYLVQWGPSKVHMVYPRGSKTLGINHQDKGQVTVFTGAAVTGDANYHMFEAYRDHFSMKAGLVVRDDRCIARLCNIDSTLTTGTGAVNEDELIRLLKDFPQRGAGAVMYMNREINVAFDIITKDRPNVYYTPDNPYGAPQQRFRGNVIKQVDQITNDETQVS